jgi:hypothetical protein
MASTVREDAARDTGPIVADLPHPERVAAPRAVLLVALAAVVAVAFIAAMLAATQGHFVPQVLDLYLIAQYAQSMAGGHPFQYNAGDVPTTGATSLLHTALLALAHRLGARGEGLIAFAILSGAVFYALTVVLAARIGARLLGAREGFAGGLFVALCGPVAWGFLYGADIALSMFLATWLLDRMLASWPRGGEGGLGWVLPAGLLALARPEGLVAALVLAGAYVLGPGRARPRRGGAAPWIPVAAGLAVILLYRVVTGSWIGSSVADKSLLANYGLRESVALVAEYLTDVVRGLLLGFYSSTAAVGTARGWASLYFPPLALLFALVAVALPRPPLASALRTWAAAALAMAVAVVPNTFLGVHFNRYLMWAFPSLLALAAVGLGLAARRLAPPERAAQRSVFWAFAGLFVLLGALSTARFAAFYGETAGEMSRRDVAAAQWIKANLPPGVAIANLASGVEFLTGHRAVNLHGVTTAAFFGNRTAEREANTLEALVRLPAPERPAYLITSVSRQAASPVMRELVEEPPLFRTASLSDELLVYRLRWELLDRSPRPFTSETAAAVQGRALVDRLNVCDAQDERRHGYAYQSHLGDVALNGMPRVADYPSGPRVADGGRAIVGFESFTVHTQPGREAVVVLRTAPSVDVAVLRASGATVVPLEFPLAGVELSLDGRLVSRTSFHARPGWDEMVLRIPAEHVTGAASRVELKGRYAAFQYWIYQ